MGGRTALACAAASDDRLRLLREMRTRLVNAIEEVSCVQDPEPSMRPLDVVSREIDDILGLPPSGSPANVIAKRRERRRQAGGVVSIAHSVAPGTTLHG